MLRAAVLRMDSGGREQGGQSAELMLFIIQGSLHTCKPLYVLERSLIPRMERLF